MRDPLPTCIVTIGPTREPLDAMRLISNRSTGELGTLLALTLKQSGHPVIALRGLGSTADPMPMSEAGVRVIPFDTTEELQRALQGLSCEQVRGGLFHTAAVSDYFLPGAGSGKIPTSSGSLTLTLEPTPKLLPRMKDWFPEAAIIGWKFEAGGTREEALAAGGRQITACGTLACVVNGPSYGEGFGILRTGAEPIHCHDRNGLCHRLAEMFASGRS